AAAHVPVFPERLGHSRLVPVSPHVLRHSFATKAVRRGVSPLVLMRLLGHSDIKTTLVCVHASSFDDLAAALDKMDWLRPRGCRRA
ncbi:MAG: site-specific integrase, partial [Anaerolineae bacterium]|nr:site-specific integrase [Anaerolineae bacterium]